jgi:4-amino-4-deoxy-L-arabinose transferase-like glycosyltransferase
VLALAAANLTIRIGQEFLTDWDEALYTTSAWEMLQNNQWAATTFQGALDYYNTKPPLNVWLVALSFKAFGVSLLSARLPSMICAWLTVLALLYWAQRTFGRATALWAGLVLSTSFGFLHVHAGRSANADAPFTLVIVLMAIAVTAADASPAALLFLGPLAAAAFLLKGFGVLLPLAFVIPGLYMLGRRGQLRAQVLAGAVALFVLPVALWVYARWRVDGWEFFRWMVQNDAIGVTTQTLDGHTGRWFYYLDTLQKHQIDWLCAGLLALAATRSWRGWRTAFAVPASAGQAAMTFWRAGRHSTFVIGFVAVACLAIPTLMRTKLPWYLNPFYPVFALLVGYLMARALAVSAVSSRRRCAVAFLAIAAVAEARIVYYSFHYRDLGLKRQAFLLDEAPRLQGHRIYAADCSLADQFVIRAMVGAEPVTAETTEGFARIAADDDYFLASARPDANGLRMVECGGDSCLYSSSIVVADVGPVLTAEEFDRATVE